MKGGRFGARKPGKLDLSYDAGTENVGVPIKCHNTTDYSSGELGGRCWLNPLRVCLHKYKQELADFIER